MQDFLNEEINELSFSYPHRWYHIEGGTKWHFTVKSLLTTFLIVYEYFWHAVNQMIIQWTVQTIYLLDVIIF